MSAALVSDVVYGVTTPRIYTPPLVRGRPGPCGCGCALTSASSLGFQAVQFASDVLGATLYPWQRWWLIHALELRPDGRFRFKTVLTLVARQQGKTWLLKVLALWAMYLGGVRLVLGAAQALDIADEAWKGAVDLIEETPELAAELAGVIRGNGKTCLTLVKRDPRTGEVTRGQGPRYRTAAATGAAGRGLSVGLLILDELRQHQTWAAWGALTKTTIAVPNSLKVLISNAGDDLSVVLNSVRDQAIAALDDPDADSTIGILEWSAPQGCELDDVHAIAQACPSLGHNPGMLEAVADARATDPPAVYRTEVLCQRVSAMDPPIDPAAWAACVDVHGSLAGVRDKIALCYDIAEDGAHATLCAAAELADGRVRFEVIAAWSSATEAGEQLAALVEQIRPRDFGWLPNGPAAEQGALLRSLRRLTKRQFVKIAEVDGRRQVIAEDEDETTRIQGALLRESSQGFAALIRSRRGLHANDPLLTAHSLAAIKRPMGDGWQLAREDGGHVDAARAAAGAVYLAQMAPAAPRVPKGRVF